MDTNTAKRSTSPIGIKDYLRKQAQEELKQFKPQQTRVASPSEVFSPSFDLQEQQTMQRMQQQEQPEMTASAQPRMSQSSILGTKAPITQAFGNYNPNIEVFSKSGVNSGTDFGVGEGTPVAVPDGQWKVLQTYDKAQGKGYIGNKENSGYGNSVLVQNPATGEKLRLSHLSQVGVKEGDVIEGGSIIGASGSTGNVTGAHLDLEFFNALGQLADILQSSYAKGLK